MESIVNSANDIISNALSELAYNEYQNEIELSVTKNSDHGILSSNIALKLSKQTHLKPHELAKDIVSVSDLSNTCFERLELAGPGFINFYIDYNKLDNFLNILINKSLKSLLSDRDMKKVMVEYSSVNIAKPIAVHHLLTTIIGQALADTYKFLGNEVERRNYLGDWGTQFGKMIYALNNWGDLKVIESDPIKELLKLYVRFHEESEKDESIIDKARAICVEIENGNPEYTKQWKWIRELSIEDIKKVYERMQVEFDFWDGESNYNDKTEDLIKEGIEIGLFKEGEKGALIADYEDETNKEAPPMLVRRSDGATLYATRDLASIKERNKTFDPDEILYVVDTAQSLHLKQVFQVANKFPWGKSSVLKHISFGRMSFKDQKMSTRKGQVIELTSLLDEGAKRAMAIIEKKTPDLEKDHAMVLAESIGIGAIKYAILSQNRSTNIVFDWDKILSLDGNSGPYMQYTIARAGAILDKSEGSINPVIIDGLELTKTEKRLLELITLFDFYINQSISSNKPNEFLTYLYEVAKKFNQFYANTQVLKESDIKLKNFRLGLVKSVHTLLKESLQIYGIKTPSKM